MIEILNENKLLFLNPLDMTEGQVGIITKWTYFDAVGRIVVREGNGLYSVDPADRVAGVNWPSLRGNGSQFHGCEVKVLPKGIQLLITIV